jgi:hypothetical protein
MSDERVALMLRQAAWARAKAELTAMLHTYWNDVEYKKIAPAVDDFIKELDELLG